MTASTIARPAIMRAKAPEELAGEGSLVVAPEPASRTAFGSGVVSRCSGGAATWCRAGARAGVAAAAPRTGPAMARHATAARVAARRFGHAGRRKSTPAAVIGDRGRELSRGPRDAPAAGSERPPSRRDHPIG